MVIREYSSNSFYHIECANKDCKVKSFTETEVLSKWDPSELFKKLENLCCEWNKNNPCTKSYEFKLIDDLENISIGHGGGK